MSVRPNNPRTYVPVSFLRLVLTAYELAEDLPSNNRTSGSIASRPSEMRPACHVPSYLEIQPKYMGLVLTALLEMGVPLGWLDVRKALPLEELFTELTKDGFVEAESGDVLTKAALHRLNDLETSGETWSSAAYWLMNELAELAQAS